MLKIAVVLEPCEEGGFTAHVPTLPGCFSEGESVEEALGRIREAIELHLEAVEDDLVIEEGSKVFELSWEAVGRDPSSHGDSPAESPPTARPGEEPRPSASPERPPEAAPVALSRTTPRERYIDTT